MHGGKDTDLFREEGLKRETTRTYSGKREGKDTEERGRG